MDRTVEANITTRSNIEIVSSHGTLTVDPADGRVLSRDLDDDLLERVIRFDLEEWKHYWGDPVPDNLDILDIGYWLDDGTYEPPEMEWRDWYVAEFGRPRHQPPEGKGVT
jgi:hypothetical protein